MRGARVWAAAISVAIVAVAAVLVLRHRPGNRWTAAITDPSMVAIRNMVVQGHMSQATAKLNTTYRFDNPSGLIALREFSLIVLQRGLKEHDLFERCYAASALAAGGEEQGLQMLTDTFQNNPDLSVKMAVADGLGEVGDRKAVAILSYLYYHGEPFDRRIIVNGLASATDPSALSVLSNAAQQRDPQLRLAALKGLGEIGNPKAIPVLKRALVSGSNPFERVVAGRSLLMLGDNSGVDAIRSVLSDHSAGNARAPAAIALGFTGDRSVVPILRAALTDEDIDVRIGAAVGLTHFGDSGGILYLKGAMNDNDRITREHVGEVLEDVSFADGHEVLMAALVSPDPNLSMSAIRAIGIHGSARDVPLLNGLLQRTNDPVARADLAWALGRIASHDGISVLIGLVREEEPAVRYTAADALDRTAKRLLGGEQVGGA
jgi:HEAT repeat protein